MGCSLCALRQSCYGKLPDEDSDEDETINERELTNELFFKKPKCLKPEDKGRDAKPTLEQCMLASPCINQIGMDASRLQGLCGQTAKVSPVSYERIYSTPRESFSSDCSHGERLGYSPRRSQSGKRVSFKLPDDDDIHIFYPCDATEDEKCEV